MKGLELKILFKESKAFISNDKAIRVLGDTLSQHIVNFKSFAYWEIRVINYIEKESRLFCEVFSYNFGKSNFSDSQQKLEDKLSNIQYISFKSVSTSGLLATLLKSGKVKNSSYIRKKPNIKSREFSNIQPFIKKPSKYQINSTFLVPFQEINFKSGYVEFAKKFEEYPNEIKLEVSNEFIKEEYDAVKNYFANVLKKDKIRVTAIIDIEDNEIKSKKATSFEIDKLNESLIDKVKLNIVKKTVSENSDFEREKNLYTSEEYFKEFSNEEIELKNFYENDQGLIEDLLKITNKKHYKHLRFLSDKHSHEKMKLRLIPNPFSFIFLIKGDLKYYFVWETLDTEEATYIWCIGKELKLLNRFLLKIEETITEIKTNGKKKYISDSKNKFKRIFHDYLKSTKGFEKWKSEFEKSIM